MMVILQKKFHRLEDTFSSSYSFLPFEYFCFSYNLIISHTDNDLKGDLFFRYVFLKKNTK